MACVLSYFILLQLLVQFWSRLLCLQSNLRYQIDRESHWMSFSSVILVSSQELIKRMTHFLVITHRSREPDIRHFLQFFLTKSVPFRFQFVYSALVCRISWKIHSINLAIFCNFLHVSEQHKNTSWRAGIETDHYTKRPPIIEQNMCLVSPEFDRAKSFNLSQYKFG